MDDESRSVRTRNIKIIGAKQEAFLEYVADLGQRLKQELQDECLLEETSESTRYSQHQATRKELDRIQRSKR